MTVRSSSMSIPEPTGAYARALSYYATAASATAKVWGWLEAKGRATLHAKRLRILENLSLRDKCSVSIVAIDEREFILGIGPSGITVLASNEKTATHYGAIAKKHDFLRKALPQRRRPGKDRAVQALRNHSRGA